MKESLSNLYSNLQGEDPNQFIQILMGRYFSHGLDSRKSVIDFKYHKRTDKNPYYLKEVRYAFSGVASPKYELTLEINVERMAYILQHYLKARLPTKEVSITTILSCRGQLSVLTNRISKLIVDSYNKGVCVNLHRPRDMGKFITNAFTQDEECIYLIRDIMDIVNLSNAQNIKMTIIERLIQTLSNVFSFFKLNK